MTEWNQGTDEFEISAFTPPVRPWACPICLGLGKKPTEFYNPDQSRETAKGTLENCRSCLGSGYIIA